MDLFQSYTKQSALQWIKKHMTKEIKSNAITCKKKTNEHEIKASN